MSGCNDMGDINFGAEISFSTDGKLYEQPARKSGAESPFQLNKPLPLSNFDREPVKISLDHPLACSTPLGPVCSDRAHCQLPSHKSTWPKKLAGNLRKTAKLARDTAQDTRSLFYQSNNSLEYINRSMMGQMQYIQDVLDGIEERINNEDHMDDSFWKNRSKDYEKCLHPVGHVQKLEARIHKIAEHVSDHTATAVNLRRGYKACEVAQKLLDQSDKYYTQICDQQILPAVDKAKETVQGVAKLHSVLYQVADSLQALRQLAPKAFRVDEERHTLGNYVEKTLCRIRTLEWAIGRHFPPQPTPVPSQQSTVSNSITTCSSTSIFSSGGSQSSVMSTASTQSGSTMPWNLGVSPVTAKSTQSISSLLTAVSGGSTDGQKTAKEPEEKKTKRKSTTTSGRTTTPISTAASYATPRKMI